MTTVKARLLSSLFESLEYLPVLSEAKAGVAMAASPPQRTRNRTILRLVTRTSLCNYMSSTSTGSAAAEPPRPTLAQHSCASLNCSMSTGAVMLENYRCFFSFCHVPYGNGRRNYKTSTLCHVGCDLLFHSFHIEWPRCCRRHRSYNGTLGCAPVGERSPIQ